VTGRGRVWHFAGMLIDLTDVRSRRRGGHEVGLAPEQFNSVWQHQSFP
jgi:hypothetical protein